MLGLGSVLVRVQQMCGHVMTSLKCWLDFESDGTDKSDNSNDTTLYTGKALSFDGVGDRVQLGSDINFAAGEPWTVAVTVKDYTTAAEQALVDGNTYRKMYLWKPGLLGPAFQGGGATWRYWSGWTPVSGETYRMVWTCDGTDVDLYINGAQQTPVSSPTDTEINIRYISAYWSGCVDATLSDFQVWDTAWDLTDIVFDLQSPQNLISDRPQMGNNSPLLLSNLKGWWHLSEGGGSRAYDNSGEGNDGTVTGATWETRQSGTPQLGLMDWSKGSNLIEYSEGFNNSYWTKSGVTFTANYATAPDGTQTAYRLMSTGGSYPQIYARPSGLTIGEVYTVSFYVKSDGTAQIQQSTHVTGVGGAVNFTPTNEWVRIEYSRTATETSHTFVTYTSSGSAAASSYLIWGYQVEKSPSATAYRKTNGTAVTDTTLISSPNNPSQDILGNSVRLREHGLNLDGGESYWSEAGYGVVSNGGNNLSIAEDFSISLWRKCDQYQDYSCLVGKGQPYNIYPAYAFAIGTQGNNRIDAYFNTAGGGVSAMVNQDATSFGKWFFIVVSYNAVSRELKLVVKREDEFSGSDTDTVPAGAITDDKPVTVGAQNNGGRAANGLIDEVKWHAGVLEEEEIEILYQEGLVTHSQGSDYSDDYSEDYGHGLI